MLDRRDDSASRVLARCLFLGLAQFTTPAWPHGPALWIQDGPYHRMVTDEPMIHCCGPSDCEMWPEQDVEVRPDGFHLKSTGEVIPFGKTYFTEAAQLQHSRYWRCHTSRLNEKARALRQKPGWNWEAPRHDTTRYGTACFFVPGDAF